MKLIMNHNLVGKNRVNAIAMSICGNTSRICKNRVLCELT
jgi:hypothetical protein